MLSMVDGQIEGGSKQDSECGPHFWGGGQHNSFNIPNSREKENLRQDMTSAPLTDAGAFSAA